MKKFIRLETLFLFTGLLLFPLACTHLYTVSPVPSSSPESPSTPGLPGNSPSPTAATSPTATPSFTPGAPTPTFTTGAPTATFTLTFTPASTATATSSPTASFSPTPTGTPTMTPTITLTPTATLSPTITPTPAFTWCSTGHLSGILGMTDSVNTDSSTIGNTYVIPEYVQSAVSILGMEFIPAYTETFLLGVYDNDSATGYPTTLLGSASVTTNLSGPATWAYVPMTPFYISAPQTIWLGIATVSTSPLFAFGTCQNNPTGYPTACLQGYDGGGYLPNPWSWGSNSVGSDLFATPCLAVSWVCP